LRARIKVRRVVAFGETATIMERFEERIREDYQLPHVSPVGSQGSGGAVLSADAPFLQLKRDHDPDEVFQSTWYRHYRAMFA